MLPDSPNFPYRRYDRLPPISQFSIESDSDLSETAELIEEYEVFDPSRPRPKVILVIGKHTHEHAAAVFTGSLRLKRLRSSECLSVNRMVHPSLNEPLVIYCFSN